MKKKSCNPLRTKRSRQVSASNECAMESGTILGSNAPQNCDTVPESASQIRHLAVSHHSDNLLKFLNEDRVRQRFCDVSVSVGGKLYCAHKVVLAHGSSYFHAELSKNPATAHVTLDHVEDSVFQLLLSFLYTSGFPPQFLIPCWYSDSHRPGNSRRTSSGLFRLFSSMCCPSAGDRGVAGEAYV